MSEQFFDEEFLLRLERIALVARRATAGQTQGERRSPKRGQSVEFADFRPYVAEMIFGGLIGMPTLVWSTSSSNCL